MSNEKRFGQLSNIQMDQMLSDKDAVNTKRATKVSVQNLREYVLETDCDIDINDCTPNDLAPLLRSFYANARKKSGELYKLSALRSIRYGLSRHFSQELEIDIIKDPLFQKANDMFSAVSVDLKRKGLARVDHKEAIEPDELKKLYTSRILCPDTPVGLLHKCWFDVMFFLCRRGRENLREMTKDSFKFARDAQGREYLYQAQDELDKNHRVDTDPNATNTEGRMYEVPGHKLCPVASFKKYLNKLNPNRNDLWQRPLDSFMDDSQTWYMNLPVGKNTLGTMLKEISEQAGLHVTYTNHSLRATNITVLDYNKFEARDIMAVSGHKSETSLKNYRNKPSKTRIHEMSTALSSALIDQNENENSTVEIIAEINHSESVEMDSFDGEILVNDEQFNELIQMADNNLGERNMDINIPGPSTGNTANSLNPFQNFAGTFTPYITNCVVNFTVNMPNK